MKSIEDIREGDEVLVGLKVTKVESYDNTVEVEVPNPGIGVNHVWVRFSEIKDVIPNWKPEEGKLAIWDGYEVLVKHVIGDEAWIQKVRNTYTYSTLQGTTQHVVRLSQLKRS